MSDLTEPGARRGIHRWVFWPAAIVVLVFAAFAIIAPTVAEEMFATVQSAIIGNLNWYYVLIAAFFVAFSLWVGFSRFGDIKLGKDDDEPEFSLGSWFALLFAAGMGIGLVFYGVSEPLSHFVDPRPGVSGTDAQLAQQALSQTYLHWGVHAWSIYVVIGLALAYAIHRRGRPLAIRWALEPLLGAKRVRGGLGHVIDAVALVGTMFGVATSLGLGVLQISSGLSVAELFEANEPVQVVLIAIITGFVLFSVLSGVNRGMKWLSNFNLGLAGVFLIALLVLGPTVFLLREFVQSIGNYLQNFIGLTFTTSAFTGAEGEAWQADWTSFYWGWWISWAPFVGIFIARISRGRTVRQFVAGVILVPTLLGILWFSVLGGSALAMQLNGTADFRDANGEIDLQAALFQLLAETPGSMVLSIGAIVLIAIFFITSADSGSLVMSMIATGGNPEPPKWVRVFFTLATSLLAIALLLGGGLDALRTAAIIIALPFSIVMLLITWSTALAFTRERRAYDRAQRAQFVERIGEYYGLEVESRDEQGIDGGVLTRWVERMRSRGPRTGA
jgi:choline/glycine/proline betaine transport protein